MSLTQTRTPSQIGQITLVPSVAWSNSENALEDNALYATASFADWDEAEPPSLVPTGELSFYDLGFTLPDDAFIDGILVTVKRFGVGSVQDRWVALDYDSSSQTSPGKQKTELWPTSATSTTYGNTDDNWNRIWTASEINDTNFGFSIAAEGDPTTLDSANIESIQIVVVYHYTINEDSTGGAIANSSASYVTTFNHEPTGIILASGNALIIDPYMPIGQANLGGTADYYLAHNPADLTEYQWINYLSGDQMVPPEDNNKWGWAYTWLNPTTNEFGWDLRLSWTDNSRLLRIHGPANYDEVGDVQLRIGQLSNDYTSPISGTTILTDEQKTDLLVGLWYWHIQSWDSENLRAQIVPIEGIQVGGAVLQTYAQFMDGGPLISQSEESIEWGIYNITSTGDSLISGNVTVIIESLVLGGSQTSGEATVIVTCDIIPENGVLVIGDADESIIYVHSVTGEVLVGSDAPKISIAPAIGGIAFLNGSHDYSFIAQPTATGGSLVTPDHVQQFTDFIDAEGGIRVGGKNITEKIRTFNSLHLNYGYAMASENIFTKVTYEKELTPPTSDVTPELPEGYFQIQHEPGWCDIEECEEGVLPKIAQRRQEPYLPPKNTRITPRDRGITRVAI